MKKIITIIIVSFILFANNILLGQTSHIDANITKSYENCNTGRIDVTMTGGFAPYTYIWSNGKTSQDILNLAVGKYTVTVTDDLCGTLEAIFEVQSKGDYFHVSTDVVHPCNNDGGTIKVKPSAESSKGCQPEFIYQWSHDPLNTTSIAEHLAIGEYSVTITGPIYSGAGCPLEKPCTVVKNFMLAPKRLIDEIVVDNLCMQGAGNGSLTVNMTAAATYPFTYVWSNGKPKKTIQDLDEGLYFVTVTDFRGCTETAKAEITSQFDLTTKVINPSGCTGADGSISLQTISTNANCGFYYTYHWDYMDKTTASIDQLEEGTYTVTITTTPGSLSCGNIKGCSVTKSFTLKAENGLKVAVKSYENFEDCEFDEKGNLYEIPVIGGNIEVDVVGGVKPYSFQWSFNGEPFATTQNINGEKADLGPGQYSLVVTDAKGCTDELGVYLCCCSSEGTPNQALMCKGAGDATPALFKLEKKIKSATTATSNDGEITVLVKWKVYQSPNPTVHYYWTDKDGNFISDKGGIKGLGPGVYKVVVSSGCYSQSLTVTIIDCATVSSSMVITPKVIANPCLGYDEGVITIDNVTGGTAPYTYRWSTGNLASTIEHLGLGTYTVTVTDAGGCGATATATISTYQQTARKGCQALCGGVVVESFYPSTKVYENPNCLIASYYCSDGIFEKSTTDDAHYEYYETFSECGVKFTCPGTGGLIKDVKGQLVNDLELSGEFLSYTGSLFGSVKESDLSNSDLIKIVSDAKPKLYCGDLTGCKFTSFLNDVYYERTYTPSDEWYPFDVDKYPFALAFAGEGIVSDGWHFIRSMEYCHHKDEDCPVTINGSGVDERCCLALFCKAEIVGIGDCKNCNQVRPNEIVLDDIKYRAALDIGGPETFKVSLAPNPLFGDKIRLSFESKDLEGVDIKIFGVLHGKTLLAGHYLLNQQIIDLSIPFLPGIYFLVIEDENGNRVIKKLVKQ